MPELRTEGKFTALLAKMSRRGKKSSKSDHSSQRHLAPSCSKGAVCVVRRKSVSDSHAAQGEPTRAPGAAGSSSVGGVQPSNHR